VFAITAREYDTRQRVLCTLSFMYVGCRCTTQEILHSLYGIELTM